MDAYEQYWISLVFIAVGAFGLGVIVGIKLMARNAVQAIQKHFGGSRSND